VTYTVRPISDRTAFTGRHTRSAFDSTWSSTEQLLEREVRAIGGRDVVLEMDLAESQIRNDGRPYARAITASPAVRLAFESKHGPLIYATDRFWEWQDNVRAIALSLEALRRVDRYGVTGHGEQYTGFKALPAGRAMPASHMTRDVALQTLADLNGIPVEHLNLGALTTIWRFARRRSHPDRNDGDRTRWDQVEQAAQVLGLQS